MLQRLPIDLNQVIIFIISYSKIPYVKNHDLFTNLSTGLNDHIDKKPTISRTFIIEKSTYVTVIISDKSYCKQIALFESYIE